MPTPTPSSVCYNTLASQQQQQEVKTVQDLCARNNNAVQMLADGSLKVAYQILQKATKEACSALATLNQWGSALMMEEDVPNTTDREDKVSVIGVDYHALLQSQSEEDRNVCLLPFWIKEPQVCHATLHKKLPAICAVLVYNMAITCHSFSYTSISCARQRHTLAQAHQLYQECVDLLHHLHLEGSLGQLLLAASNNILQIVFQSGNLTETKYWHQTLLEAFNDSKNKSYNVELLRAAFSSTIYFSCGTVCARAA